MKPVTCILQAVSSKAKCLLLPSFSLCFILLPMHQLYVLPGSKQNKQKKLHMQYWWILLSWRTSLSAYLNKVIRCLAKKKKTVQPLCQVFLIPVLPSLEKEWEGAEKGWLEAVTRSKFQDSTSTQLFRIRFNPWHKQTLCLCRNEIMSVWWCPGNGQ